MDETSSEGHHLRKLHDLELRRSRTPLFVLSWTVIHKIDENSPLRNVDWTRPEEHLVSMVATLTGHDSTYAQTIHARKQYFPEQFQPGRRFVDVISDLDDGRLQVDYRKFHLTIPD